MVAVIYKSHYYFRYRVQIDRVQAADPRKINLEAMVSIGLLGKLAPPLGITKKNTISQNRFSPAQLVPHLHPHHHVDQIVTHMLRGCGKLVAVWSVCKVDTPLTRRILLFRRRGSRKKARLEPAFNTRRGA